MFSYHFRFLQHPLDSYHRQNLQFMATLTGRAQCFSCKKETRRFSCEGCSKDFCAKCLTEHLEELGRELDKIENDHDQFRQILDGQKDDPKKQSLITQINQWEKDSIDKIKQTAEECRKKLISHTNSYMIELEHQLNSISKEIKRIRQDNEFNEIDLKEFKEKLDKLEEELEKSSNVSVQEQSSPFINKMSVILPVNKGKKIRSNK